MSCCHGLVLDGLNGGDCRWRGCGDKFTKAGSHFSKKKIFCFVNLGGNNQRPTHSYNE